jgi:predicted transcriptional regulator
MIDLETLDGFTEQAKQIDQQLQATGFVPTKRSRTPNYVGESVTFSLSPALKAGLYHAADEQQSSTSGIIRRALLEYLPTIDPQFTTIFNNLRNQALDQIENI